ncbi:MAG: lipid-binding SYLF domain-containing protein [Chitinophagaceae bacterium]
MTVKKSTLIGTDTQTHSCFAAYLRQRSDASVTAGPVGRNSSASTDYKIEAEIYSYSKSKGLFAGISISGSALDIDEKANNNFYEEEIDAKTIFENNSNSSAQTVAIKQTLSNLFK